MIYNKNSLVCQACEKVKELESKNKEMYTMLKFVLKVEMKDSDLYNLVKEIVNKYK